MKTFLSLLLFLCIIQLSLADEYSVKSPDNRIDVKVSVTGIISYAIEFNNVQVISSSTISLSWDGDKKTGKKPQVKKITTKRQNDTIKPVVPRKFKKLAEEFNELKIDFRGKYSIIFRAYNDGVAYRWSTHTKDSITITNEQATFNFTDDHHIWFPEEESMFSHQERLYKYISLSEIDPSMFCSTPTLLALPGNIKVLISESDLLDYPGMFLKGNKENPYGLQAKFAGYPMEVEQENDRSVRVIKYAPFLAKTKGKREFPWRAILITDQDEKLVESELIWKLASPSKIADPNWIKPGKVAWDWWNDWNIYGVDFEAGINTETYKYYIDFAAANQIEYIILDEGWYHLENVLKIKDAIDLSAIVSYGKEKKVGIILWVTWKAFYDQLELALDTFQEWGIKGIKVDFMQRDDQWMVNYYSMIAEKAAEHQLLVDFHGAYKPTGLHRTFPNVLTFEGVLGNEHNKWGENASPDHNLILPFTRMVAGPMDYTPGAMINATKKNFRPVWSKPMSQGTRCHQLAMYVVYESPLQMLCDNPSNYIREPETMEFLSGVPVTWDDTKVLKAKAGEYILMARQKDNNWYVAGMTNWNKREFDIDFNFLEEGNYELKIWQDGVNTDRNASDYKFSKQEITNNSKLHIKLASGGGWVAEICPQTDKD